MSMGYIKYYSTRYHNNDKGKKNRKLRQGSNVKELAVKKGRSLDRNLDFLVEQSLWEVLDPSFSILKETIFYIHRQHYRLADSFVFREGETDVSAF